MSDDNKQQPSQEIQREKGQEQPDPVDLARLEREGRKARKGWSAGQKFNFLIFKIIIFVFIVAAMGMCSVKYIS